MNRYEGDDNFGEAREYLIIRIAAQLNKIES